MIDDDDPDEIERDRAAVVAVLGGEDEARALVATVSPRTRRALALIAALGHRLGRDPEPAACVVIALRCGATPEAVLAAIHGYWPAPGESGADDPEVIAAGRIAAALAATE